MDADSFLTGYLTGVALHGHLRPGGMLPRVLAAMSVTGLRSDVTWRADLRGVAAVTFLTANHSGGVTAAWSVDGETYTEPVPLGDLLRADASAFPAGAGFVWFRFHLDAGARLTDFILYGF